MWQTIIVFVLVMAFKAFAAYAQHKKKQELELKKGRGLRDLGTERVSAAQSLAQALQAVVAPTVPPAPVSAAEPEGGPAPIVGYHSHVHESEGEASAKDLAKTVAMIHRGVLEEDVHGHHPVEQAGRSQRPRAARIAGAEWRRAVRLGTVLGAPRAIDPA